MPWLTANWFWVAIGIAFVAMHLFGHGGHGGHARHGEGDWPEGRVEENQNPRDVRR